jgi:uridine phosphorylase
VSKRSIGFDGLLNYYSVPADLFDLKFEKAFCDYTQWNKRLPAPYVVAANEELVQRIGFDMIQGITISAPGFYGPQGRYVRLKPNDNELNEKIRSFRYSDEMVTNFEMESSALAGLARLLGHKAMTVCAIIAGRVSKDMNTEYKGSIEELIKIVLERI